MGLDKKRRRWPRRLALGLGLALLLAFLAPPSRECLIGLLRNEAFFDGKPTSYWSKCLGEALGKEFVRYLDHPSGLPVFPPAAPSRTQSFLERIFPFLQDRPRKPKSILEGDERSIPVLVQLLRDPEPRVRTVAAVRLAALAPAKSDKVVPALLRVVND